MSFYSLSPDERYEFDVKHNPSILLRPLASRVLIPQTKLSLLAIQWVTRNFGLGKKVFSRRDIDFTMFWNADPLPPDSPPSLDIIPLVGDQGGDMDHMDGGEDGIDYGSFPWSFLAAFETWPLEKWIHFRFCRTYEIHGWAHDRFVRVLLFQFFCHLYDIPSPDVVSTAIHITRKLRLILDGDIWTLVEPYLLDAGMQEWKDWIQEGKWTPAFRAMTRDERGVMVIFSDAVSIFGKIDSITNLRSPAFLEVHSFLTSPLDHCTDKSDILHAASAEGDPLRVTSFDSFVIPDLDAGICICGICVSLQDHLKQNPDNFQMKYLRVSHSDDRGGCNALEKTWDPLFSRAERWVDKFMDKIECPFDLFPSTSERRLGISIMEVLFILNVNIDAHLDTRQLLHFVTYLRYRHLLFDDPLEQPPEMAQDNFAFVTADSNDDSRYVMSTAGGWLHDIAGGGLDDQNATISFIPTSATFHIRYLSLNPPEIAVIDMPQTDFAEHIIIPPDHTLLDAPAVPPTQISVSTSVELVIVHLSRGSNHGFPLFCGYHNDGSLRFCPRDTETYEKYAAQISTFFCNRIVRTWWKPYVEVGRPCPHSTAHNVMTRCSLTSKQVLLQVKPCADPLSSRWLETESVHDVQAEAEQTGATFYQYLKETTARLTERDGPFERGRLCIVRCGDEDGPVDPLIILAASLGMKGYVFHFRECWNCACLRMRAQGCTLGIAVGSKILTKCAHCVVADRRAEHIMAEFGLE